MFLIFVSTVCHHPIWNEQNGSLSFNEDALDNGQDLDERFVGVYPTGTIVTYNCDNGYSLSGGSRTRTCTLAGLWFPYRNESSRLPYTCVQGNYKCNCVFAILYLKLD